MIKERIVASVLAVAAVAAAVAVYLMLSGATWGVRRSVSIIAIVGALGLAAFSKRFVMPGRDATDVEFEKRLAVAIGTGFLLTVLLIECVR